MKPTFLIFLMVGAILLAASGCVAPSHRGPGEMSNVKVQAGPLEELKRRNLAFDADTFVNAAAAGDEASVSLFLAAGMDPNATNRVGVTALMWAAGQGREPVVKTLLAHGADLQRSASDGSPALAFAARQGQINTASLLLQAGAQINSSSNPLLAAASENREPMARFLLSKGADVEAADPDGYTSLFFAANNVLAEDANGASLALLTTLLKSGAKANATALDGSTPLMWAAGKGEAGNVESLLTAGADPKAVDKQNKTVLMRAIEGGADPGLAKRLIEAKVELNAQDSSGETALMKACRRKRLGMAVALLSAGANPNLQDEQGRTALMIAASYGNGALVDSLLKAGADAALKDARGRTAYQLANEQHTAALDHLIPAGR